MPSMYEDLLGSSAPQKQNKKKRVGNWAVQGKPPPSGKLKGQDPALFRFSIVLPVFPARFRSRAVEDCLASRWRLPGASGSAVVSALLSLVVGSRPREWRDRARSAASRTPIPTGSRRSGRSRRWRGTGSLEGPQPEARPPAPQFWASSDRVRKGSSFFSPVVEGAGWDHR